MAMHLRISRSSHDHLAERWRSAGMEWGMIPASAPTLPPAPMIQADQLRASVGTLADRAAAGGRDVAAGLLQGILRELRAGSRVGA